MKLRRGITVDSGAANNVIPKRLVRGRRDIRPSAMSRRGAHYVAANDGRIANEGEVDFKFQTMEGQDKDWTFQVAEVNKALASISFMVDHGYRVTFDKDEETGHDLSMMLHKASNTITRFRRDRNVWVLDAIVDMNVPGKADESFHRRA